jgi:hypothetical protein
MKDVFGRPCRKYGLIKMFFKLVEHVCAFDAFAYCAIVAADCLPA